MSSTSTNNYTCDICLTENALHIYQDDFTCLFCKKSFPIHQESYSSSEINLDSNSSSNIDIDPFDEILTWTPEDQEFQSSQENLQHTQIQYLHHFNTNLDGNPRIRRQGDYEIDNYRNTTGEQITWNSVNVASSNIIVNLKENTVTLYLADDLKYLLPATRITPPLEAHSPTESKVDAAIVATNEKLRDHRNPVITWDPITEDQEHTAPTWEIKESNEWKYYKLTAEATKEEIEEQPDYFSYKPTHSHLNQHRFSPIPINSDSSLASNSAVVDKESPPYSSPNQSSSSSLSSIEFITGSESPISYSFSPIESLTEFSHRYTGQPGDEPEYLARLLNFQEALELAQREVTSV